VPFSRRRLPHNYPEGKWLFLTWHLHGSLPHGRVPAPDKSSAGEAFVWIDRYLDQGKSGPLFLRQPAIARIVVDSLHKGVDLGHFDLGAFVVMANHVHTLLLPKISPSRLLQSMKGAAAREANRILGRTGQPFWQAESYDHWVRDDREYARIRAYIENNPVKAGLVERPEQYPWSSASAEERLDTIVETASHWRPPLGRDRIITFPGTGGS
jgi:REP element-mobilizing transposase RayT